MLPSEFFQHSNNKIFPFSSWVFRLFQYPLTQEGLRMGGVIFEAQATFLSGLGKLSPSDKGGLPSASVSIKTPVEILEEMCDLLDGGGKG